MSTVLKQKKDLIKVKQFVTDSEGHKVAAIIEIDELERLEELIEDMSDIKAIEGKAKEVIKVPKKVKAFCGVKPVRGKGIPASKLLIGDRR